VTVTELRPVYRINLSGGCANDHCLKMAWDLKHQLDPKYRHGAAVMDISKPVEWRKTARKRSEKAKELGYRFESVNRADHEEDLYTVNTSKAERQGRPMSAGYQDPQTYDDPPMRCPLHHVYTYGILDKHDHLRAYLWLYRSGQLAMVSSILGHADHLENGIMYRLFLKMVANQRKFGGTVFYNLWNSGQEGLRFFKERVGLREGDVEWLLS
jgi:hypothetical protein